MSNINDKSIGFIINNLKQAKRFLLILIIKQNNAFLNNYGVKGWRARLRAGDCPLELENHWIYNEDLKTSLVMF